MNSKKLIGAMAVKGILTQDLCKKANISERIMKQILSGTVEVDVVSATKIAWVLNLKREELEEMAGDRAEQKC